MDSDNYYQVDPASTRHDSSDRYPRNYVSFAWYLRALNWGDSLSRAVRGQPAYLLKDSLLDIFDAVHAPAERWGSAREIGVLRENLQALSTGFDGNPHLSPTGRLLLRTVFAGHLRNRAATIDFYERNREFIEANGRFRAPLIVTGFPRTGSTLLLRLISEDPNTRSPYTFEMEKSTPPLKTGMDPLLDPRIRKSAASMAIMSRLAPGFVEKLAESHFWSATEREESMLYTQYHHGMSLTNGIAAGRRCFRRMQQIDAADALMKYERNFFTMLDAYAPAASHWSLKAPSYAPYFSKIFDHYPEALVVVTHRHPAKNLASVCRLLETINLVFDRDGSFDKRRFGGMLRDETEVFLSAPLEARREHSEHESRIADCMYQDLMRDPIGMVGDIYAKFGLEYTPEFEDRMQRYLEQNRQGRHGRHKYSNEEYGIDPASLYEQNKAYFDHYGFKSDPGMAD